MTFVTIKGEWNLLTIFTGFSAAPTELFRTVISLSTLLHPRWKKKGTARKRVWSKAQFSWRHRWPGMRKQISVFFHLPRKHVWRCSFFLRFFCFFFSLLFFTAKTTSLRGTRHYRDDTISPVANFVCDYSREPPRLPTSIHPLPLVKWRALTSSIVYLEAWHWVTCLPIVLINFPKICVYIGITYTFYENLYYYLDY